MELATGFQVVILREHSKIGKRDVLPGQQLLGQPLVTTDVEFSGSTPRIGNAEQLQDSGNTDIAQDGTFGESLQEIKDQIRLAPE